MRWLALGTILSLAAIGVDKFVTPDQLPTVDKTRPVVTPEADPQPAPTPTPIKQGCQCGCNRAACGCAKSMTSCSSPLQLDATAVERFARMSGDVPEVWVFAPLWCAACPAHEKRLGNGDETVRLVWKHQEAHFTPANGFYPCFYYPSEGKQLLSTPATVADIRKGFGIKPKTSLAVIQVGTLSRSALLPILSRSQHADSVTMKNDSWTEDVYGYPVTIPKDATVSKVSVPNGHRYSFSPNLKTEMKTMLGTIKQDCNAVVITTDRVELELPSAPDVYFKLVD